ncbi:MAG: hypothetical protein C0484_12750 [Rhodospirillum sp.]|nr:hypothetical protein [Rhodospirillum sp.]
MHSSASSTGRPRRAIGIVAGAMALLATASCATNEDIASYPCPFVGAVRELSYTTKFEGESQDLSDTLYEAKVDQVLPAVNCIYENNDGKQAIVYDIQVKFLAQRGPKEHEGVVKFNYFVGIGGPGGQILKREVFDSQIVFENNATQAITIEEIQPRIPLKQGENGDYYRIYIGFMLSERELAYNRKNPR